MLDDVIGEINEQGFAVLPSVLSDGQVELLRSELDDAMKEDLSRTTDLFDAGMVHNCMVRGPEMAKILDVPTMNQVVSKLLNDTFILYAYQSSSLKSNSSNYGQRIHVDSPRFIPNYPTNIGVIFPLDDFTKENGATHLLSGSHLREKQPNENKFYEESVRAVCNAGDMLVFHARVWHCSGFNSTSKTRHSLTLNFCRSYMRQRFDFPKLISQEIIDSLGEDALRLIGMNVRMPVSLEEFYLPEEQRLYKSNQG